jgi:hypothetical protein
VCAWKCIGTLLASWWGLMLHHNAASGSYRCFRLISCPPAALVEIQVFSSGKWASGGQRAALLKHIADSPSAAWPAGGPFKFKNPHK